MKRKGMLEMGRLRRARRQPGVLFIVAILSLAGLAGGMGSPPPVSNFDCGGFTNDRIIATWDSYNASAQLLDLRWRYAGTATWLGGVELNTTDTPSYTIDGLDIGTQYELSIQALGLHGAGYSIARNVLGETLFGTRATNVRPTTITERTVTVQWSLATSADVVSQKVYVSWDRGQTYRFNTVVDQGPLLGKTVTELLIPSLEPLTDYMFVVETLFVGAGGAIRSLPSRLITTLGAAPDQVTRVQALNVMTTSLLVRWTPLVGKGQIGANTVVYRIEVREGGAPFPDPGPFVVEGVETFQVNGLLRNTLHRIRITAINDAGVESPPSNVLLVTTQGAVPLAPLAPTVVLVSNGLQVNWPILSTNHQTGGFPITEYLVHRKREDEMAFDAGVSAGLGTSLLVSSGLTANYRYEIAVSAVNSVGSSPLSPPSPPTLPPEGPVPPAPVANVSRDESGSIITLTWTPPPLSTNVMAYKVMMRQVAPASIFDSGLIVGEPTATYRFLPDFTRFEFKVQALTGVGWTADSSVTVAETGSDDTPTGAAATFSASTCRLDVSWTAPRVAPVNYRLFINDVNDPSNSYSRATVGLETAMVINDCIRGATFTFSVQALYPDTVSSVASSPSRPITIPPSVPGTMPAPTVVASTVDPSTMMIVSWPQLSNGYLTGGSPIIDVTVSILKTSDGIGQVVTVGGTETTYTATDLQQDTQYLIRTQARNALGSGAESPSTIFSTTFSTPDKITNFSVIDGSEFLVTGDSPSVTLSIQWSIPRSGDAFPVKQYRVYKYSLTDDYNEGEVFCVNGGVLPNTPLPGFTLTCVSTSNYRTLTLLLGGVDYTFFIQAINQRGLEGPLSEAFEYRTISVVPKSIDSLQVTPVSSPDRGSGYFVGLNWDISLEAAITGGSALNGFVVRYSVLTQCLLGCSDSSAACLAQRINIPWTSVGISGGTGLLGEVGNHVVTVIKGYTYVFSIAARNIVGQGPFWPSCLPSDSNCNVQGSPACFDPVTTKPVQIQNFGVLGPDRPNAFPMGTSQLRVQWGVNGQIPDPYYDYTDRLVNGGRNVIKVEVQRTEAGLLNQFPLDHYCPDLPSNGQCLYQVGCTPDPCIAQCPVCITDQNERQGDYTNHYYNDFFNLEPAKIYVYRIRFSNVDSCTGGTIPVGTTSSNCYTWSDWSDLSYVQVQQETTYSNIITESVSPISIRVGWVVPFNSASGPAFSGDQVIIYYGTDVSQVTTPFTGALTVNGGESSVVGTTQGNYAVTGLKPATTYYVNVVGYFSTGNPPGEIAATRSGISFATKTKVGIPQQVKNVTLTIPPEFVDRLDGSFIVSWDALPANCEPSDGVVLADGSIATCPRGEDADLLGYRIYYKLSSATTWIKIFVPPTTTSYMIKPLEKGLDYSFQVTSVNSDHESVFSTEVGNRTLVTVPGPPPAPLMNGASPTSLRISWQEPPDTGASVQLQLAMSSFLVVIFPRRDQQPGNETMVFQTARQTVLTGLLPNTNYQITVAGKNNYYDLFGVASETLWAASTPYAPVNLRRSSANNTFGYVLVEWDWEGVVQGPLPIIGYRITMVRENTNATTTTLCTGGDNLQCRLDGFSRGVQYTLTVSASNDPRLETSFGPESLPLVVSTPASLPTVTILSFSNTTSESTTIHWAAEDGGMEITGYQIRFQREAEGFGNFTDITGPNSYTFYGLGPNLVYSFKVVAINAAGYRESNPSPGVLTRPAPPTTPEIISVSSRTAGIRWERWYGKNPVRDHVVQARYNNGPGFVGDWFAVGQVSNFAVETTVSGLNPNSGMDIRVAARNDAGVGFYSLYGSTTTLPEGPSLVYVGTITGLTVEVNWVEAGGADGRYFYKIFPYARVGAEIVPQGSYQTSMGPITSWTISGLQRGATYFFRVASCSDLGDGEQSAPSHDIVTLLSVPYGGAKPVASVATPNSITVTWDATGPLDGGGSPLVEYVIEGRYERGGFYSDWHVVKTVVSSVVSTVVDGLVGNAAYQFRILVRNAIGLGPPGDASDPFSTLPGPMPAPRQQAFLSTILLFWDPPVNATTTGYRVYFQEYDTTLLPSPDWQPYSLQVVAPSTLTMKFDTLKSDNRYRFWLASRNPSGWGADGEIIESRTTIRPDAWTISETGQLAMFIQDSSITPTSAMLTWYGPATDPVTGPGLRGSAVGYQVIACSVEQQLCDPGTELMTLCVDTLPYSNSHCCTSGCTSYTRGGLLKNTLYYFHLAVVNPGGPGPYSRPSPTFRTDADFPAVVGTPTVVNLGAADSVKVLWTPITDWNDRGGLDITAYYLYRREEGGTYMDPEVVYDGSEFTLTNLPANTKYYFSVNSENTWCTTCPSEGQCLFPACCEDHTCTAKSPETAPISTLPGKMPLPRAMEITTARLDVTWDPLSGTPNNIYRYELMFRDLDMQRIEDTGGWTTIVFPGNNVNDYRLDFLRSNNKYEVLMRADNQEGYGEQSDSAILYTIAERVEAPVATQIRATAVLLEWPYPPGRQANIIGYNVTYREATDAEKSANFPLEGSGVPFQSEFFPGNSPTAQVVSLSPNATYVFAVAAVNGGGAATASPLSMLVTTMPQDRLATCLFYQVGAAPFTGTLTLQESAIGNPPSTLSGVLSGVPQAGAEIWSIQYGQSSNNSYHGQLFKALSLNVTDVTPLDAFPVEEQVALPLQGETSVLSSSLIVVPAGWGESGRTRGQIMAQCELGLAAPRGGAFRNEALPPRHSRAFCRIQSPLPLPEGGGISGGFIASPTDRGLRIRGRVCGFPPGMSGVPLKLHEYGDLGDGTLSGLSNVGGVAFDMGAMVIDNLGSANFDMVDEPGVTFEPTSLTGIMGRPVVVYHEDTGEVLGGCVFGAYEPDIGTTQFNELAMPTSCVACTWLLGIQDSLFSVAEKFGNDWLSVWSLNQGGNPDLDQSGTSIYYAHPYQIGQGESVISLMRRFGLNVLELTKLNPRRTSYAEGDVVCIMPIWRRAIDRNSLYVCREEDAPAPLNTTQAVQMGGGGESSGSLGGGMGVANGGSTGVYVAVQR